MKLSKEFIENQMHIEVKTTAALYAEANVINELPIITSPKFRWTAEFEVVEGGIKCTVLQNGKKFSHTVSDFSETYSVLIETLEYNPEISWDIDYDLL